MDSGLIDAIVLLVFLKHKVIAHAVAATIFHHVATRVFQSHSVHRNLPKIGEHLRHIVVVGTGTVIDVVDDGGVAVFKDVPRTIVTDPIRVRLGVHEGDIAHVDACILESALGLALLRTAHDAIHHAVVR